MILRPEGWPRPRGYENGVVQSGKIVSLAGQIGWDPRTSRFESDDLVGQVRQALHNIIELLLNADARPTDLVRLTWYMVDRAEYLASLKEIGAVYREIVGEHYPAMSVVFVSSLVESRARVEIEATAVIPGHAD